MPPICRPVSSVRTLTRDTGASRTVDEFELVKPDNATNVGMGVGTIAQADTGVPENSNLV
jgi:hypothetical protein